MAFGKHLLRLYLELKLTHLLRKFFRNQDGNSGLGYALFIGVGVAILVLGMSSIGSSVEKAFERTGDSLGKATRGEVTKHNPNQVNQANSHYQAGQR